MKLRWGKAISLWTDIDGRNFEARRKYFRKKPCNLACLFCKPVGLDQPLKFPEEPIKKSLENNHEALGFGSKGQLSIS